MESDPSSGRRALTTHGEIARQAATTAAPVRTERGRPHTLSVGTTPPAKRPGVDSARPSHSDVPRITLRARGQGRRPVRGGRPAQPRHLAAADPVSGYTLSRCLLGLEGLLPFAPQAGRAGCFRGATTRRRPAAQDDGSGLAKGPLPSEAEAAIKCARRSPLPAAAACSASTAGCSSSG